MDSLMLQLSDEYRRLREEKEILEKQLKVVNGRIKTVKPRLLDVMDKASISKFSRGGKTFSTSSRIFMSPETGQKEQLIKALRDHGRDDIVTVNSSMMASLAKEQRDAFIDAGGDPTAPPSEWLPDWLRGVARVYERENISMTKA